MRRKGGGSGRNPFRRDNPLAASYLCVFLYSSGEASLHVLVPPYLSDGRGFGPGLIGTVLAIFGLSSLLTRLPVGAGYRATRVRPLLLAGGILSAGAFAVMPFIDGPVVIAGLMAMDGVGWAMATTTQLTVLVASRPSHLAIASVMGWYSGFTGLGNAVGGAAAGMVADGLGYTAGFLLLASFPALATVVMLRSLPGQLAAASQANDAERSDDAPGHTIRRTDSPQSMLSVVRSAGTLPMAVYGGALIMFFINVHNALLSTFQPVLALAAGLTLTQIGLLASVRSLTSSATRIASGPIFSRVSGRSLTTPMFLIGVATLYLVPVFRESFWLQAVVFALAGLSRGLLRVTGTASAFEDAGDGRPHGLVSAFLYMGLDLGKVLGPPIGGVLAEWVGVPAMFKVAAAGLFAAYLAFLLAARLRGSAARRAA
ncbi:MAG: MFS transporter [Streptosporangiales bacterium]|nr:MFS transporter [Streptosporangiales bacterium]